MHYTNKHYVRDCPQLIVLYTDTRADPCGSEHVILTASSGTIRSPGYDNWYYPNNRYCQWLIQAPHGNVRLTNIAYFLH